MTLTFRSPHWLKYRTNLLSILWTFLFLRFSIKFGILLMLLFWYIKLVSLVQYVWHMVLVNIFFRVDVSHSAVYCKCVCMIMHDRSVSKNPTMENRVCNCWDVLCLNSSLKHHVCLWFQFRSSICFDVEDNIFAWCITFF